MLYFHKGEALWNPLWVQLDSDGVCYRPCRPVMNYRRWRGLPQGQEEFLGEGCFDWLVPYPVNISESKIIGWVRS